MSYTTKVRVVVVGEMRTLSVGSVYDTDADAIIASATPLTTAEKEFYKRRFAAYKKLQSYALNYNPRTGAADFQERATGRIFRSQCGQVQTPVGRHQYEWLLPLGDRREVLLACALGASYNTNSRKRWGDLPPPLTYRETTMFQSSVTEEGVKRGPQQQRYGGSRFSIDPITTELMVLQPSALNISKKGWFLPFFDENGFVEKIGWVYEVDLESYLDSSF